MKKRMTKKIIINRCDQCPYVSRMVVRKKPGVADEELWMCRALGSVEIERAEYKRGHLNAINLIYQIGVC